MAAQDEGHFRFLDLPAELRLMVYDYLPIRTKQHTLHATKTKVSEAINDRPSAVPVSHHVSAQILRGCRVLQNEAQAAISRQISKIRNMMPRAIINSSALHLLYGEDGVVTHIIWWLEALHANPEANFDNWMRARQSQMRDDVRQFIQQAAMQMLAQWHKNQRSGVSTSQAAIFFVCQIRTDQGRSALPTLSKRHMAPMLCNILFHNRGFRCTPNRPLSAPSDVVFMWLVPVAMQDDNQFTTVQMKGIWEYLVMNHGWDIAEKLH
jgi:hypothetical protein